MVYHPVAGVAAVQVGITENPAHQPRILVPPDEAGEPLYVTQGDANNAPDDEPAAQSQVEGRMIGLVPAVGRISLWFHTDG